MTGGLFFRDERVIPEQIQEKVECNLVLSDYQ